MLQFVHGVAAQLAEAGDRPEVALQLFLAGAQCASEVARLELIAYEFFEQARARDHQPRVASPFKWAFAAVCGVSVQGMRRLCAHFQSTSCTQTSAAGWSWEVKMASRSGCCVVHMKLHIPVQRWS